MGKNRIYTKHQAFNTAYAELKNNSKDLNDGFDRPKKYHHAPDKLDIFTSYKGYFYWSNDLYASSTQLIGLLRDIYDKSEKAKSFFGCNRKKRKKEVNEKENMS